MGTNKQKIHYGTSGINFGSVICRSVTSNARKDFSRAELSDMGQQNLEHRKLKLVYKNRKRIIKTVVLVFTNISVLEEATITLLKLYWRQF